MPLRQEIDECNQFMVFSCVVWPLNSCASSKVIADVIPYEILSNEQSFRRWTTASVTLL